MRRLFTVVATAATILLGLTTAAQADHSVLDLVSTGPTAQPCPPGASDLCRATFLGASLDGRHALVRTKQPLVHTDSNDTDDVYEWNDGTARRVAQGLTSARLSDDGSRVLFMTNSALVPEDTDGAFFDAYELIGSTYRLVSAPPGGSSAPNHAIVITTTRDNSKTFFDTTEALVASDTDTTADIYEREGATLRLVTVGLEIGSGGYSYEGASHDGDHVLFQTTRQMVPTDTDALPDVYERTAGDTRLVTTGPQTPGDGFGLFCCFMSADGEDVMFGTEESLVPEDTDGNFSGCIDDMEESVSCGDVYLRSGGSTTLISRQEAACGGPPFFGGCYARATSISEDGSRILFTTDETYSSQDTNGANDLYEWQNGDITLVSAGPSGVAGDIQFTGSVQSSNDGQHVFFRTTRTLTSDDLDGFRADIYKRFNGTTTLLSQGPSGQPNCCNNDIRIGGASADGSSVFASTANQLVAEDVNSSQDVYELTLAGSTLLSRGLSAQGGAIAATPCCVSSLDMAPHSLSEDGSRVFIETAVQLVPHDTDDQNDIYMSRRASTAGYARPKGATPMVLPLVTALKPCTAPNREHGPPLAHGSCSPAVPESPNLVVSAGESQLRSIGSVLMRLLAGAPGGPDDTDVQLRFSLTNVMNAAGFTEYAGELRPEIQVRRTDREATSSTTQDFPLSWTVPCAPTADPQIASSCVLDTTLDAIVPGAAAEGTRGIWALDRLRVFDGGPDGDADTTGDNSLFAAQGVFVP